MKKILTLIGSAVFLLATGAPLVHGQSAEKTYEVVMSFMTFLPTPTDLKLVQDEINKITQAKIGAKIKILPLTPSTYNQQLNLVLSGDEKMDIVQDGTILGIAGRINRNQLLALDDLLDTYGAGIKAAIGPEYLEAARFKGKVYGLTTMRDLASGLAVLMRKDLVDKHKIDVSKIKSLADLTAVFQVIKEKEPSVTPVITGSGASFLSSWRSYDSLGGNGGVLLNQGASLKVENWYESAEYRGLVNTIYDWGKKGYVMKDIMTNSESVYSIMRTGHAFAYLLPDKPETAKTESIACGTEMVAVPLVPPFNQTGTVTNYLWSIPRNCQNPEKTMQMMNLLYSDPQVSTLLIDGIEGKHYVKTADGLIDFPKGMDGENSPYFFNISWAFPNQMITPVWKGMSPDLWKKLDAYNKTSKSSKAMGFNFDTTPVKTQVTAVTNVTAQYGKQLECGQADPGKVLPEFLAKLKKAGIDKIIAEKQKQLDAWAKTRVTAKQ